MSELYPNMSPKSLYDWAKGHGLEDFLKIPARTLLSFSPQLESSWIWANQQSQTAISDLISAETQGPQAEAGAVPSEWQLAAIQLLQRYMADKNKALEEEQDIIDLLPPPQQELQKVFQALQLLRHDLRRSGIMPRSRAESAGARFWIASSPLRLIYKEERQAWCGQGSWPEITLYISKPEEPNISCSCHCPKKGQCPIGISAIDRSLQALLDPLESRLHRQIIQHKVAHTWEQTLQNLNQHKILPLKGELVWIVKQNQTVFKRLEAVWAVHSNDEYELKPLNSEDFYSLLSVKNQYFIDQSKTKISSSHLRLLYTFKEDFKLIQGSKRYSTLNLACPSVTLLFYAKTDDIGIKIQCGSISLDISAFYSDWLSQSIDGYLAIITSKTLELSFLNSAQAECLELLSAHASYPKHSLPTLMAIFNNYFPAAEIDFDSSLNIPEINCSLEYSLHFYWTSEQDVTLSLHASNDAHQIQKRIDSIEANFVHLYQDQLALITRDRIKEDYLLTELDNLSHSKGQISGSELWNVISWAQSEHIKIKCISHESLYILDELKQIHCQLSYKSPSYELQGHFLMASTPYPLIQILSLIRKNVLFSVYEQKLFLISPDIAKQLLLLADVLQPTKAGLRLDPVHISSLQPLLHEEGLQMEYDDNWKDITQRWQNRPQEPNIPHSFKGILRPYQKEGLSWLQGLEAWAKGALLADEMGLGKTIQCIAFLAAHMGSGPFLVVCPSSLLFNWSREILKFCPQLRPIIYHGENRHPLLEDENQENTVFITSYTTLRIDQIRFENHHFSVLILDEAQALKNPHSKRHQAVRRIQRQWTLALSGTPIENNLMDLWSIFHCIDPTILGAQRVFQHRFIQIESKDRLDRKSALQKIIAPFFKRRTKRIVLKELPPTIDIQVDVVLSPEEEEQYKRLYQAMRERINLSDPKLRFQILKALLQLRQFACHPKLIDPYSAMTSSKLERCLELVHELKSCGKSILVFSQFVQFLSLIKERLDKDDIAYSYFDGQSSLESRDKNIAQFQSKETQLFLISLKAGGLGLNLTEATEVILLDPWWNPAIEDQAVARAHRMGQKEPVSIYRLVARNTVEEQVIQLQAEKRLLMAELMNDSQPNFDISLLLDILQLSPSTH